MIHLLSSLFLLLFYLEQLTSNLSLAAKLLTQAISGEVSDQEGEGSIGARATHAASLGHLTNLVAPLTIQNSPLVLTLDPFLTLLLWQQLVAISFLLCTRTAFFFSTIFFSSACCRLDGDLSMPF